jgi:hypothetical protein
MKRKQVSLAPTAHTNIAASAAGDDDLASTEGVDYTPLRDLLQSHNWREADRETLALMRRVAKGDLEPIALARFPPVDLRTIDQLWVKYSGGRFGFSVQKYILRECESAATPFDTQTHQRFGERVGWKDWSGWHNARTYTLNAPAGHLPNYTSFEIGEQDDDSFMRQPQANEGNNFYKVSALLSREDLPSTKPTEPSPASAKRKHKR